jgi:phosphohistidine phosphatase
MKRLYLLRHAKSSWQQPGTTDFDRPLAPRGIAACKRIRATLRRLAIEPQLVLCSSARRTRETFEGVAKGFAHEPEALFERGLYLASANKILARLAQLDDSTERVMVIGHNPGLERLAQALAGTGAAATLARLATKFPTGALAELAIPIARWDAPAPGGAELVRFIAPRDGDD